MNWLRRKGDDRMRVTMQCHVCGSRLEGALFATPAELNEWSNSWGLLHQRMHEGADDGMAWVETPPRRVGHAAMEALARQDTNQFTKPSGAKATTA